MSNVFLLIPLSTLLSFMAAGILLNLTPGADVMFATACGLKGGAKSGIAAAFGIALGSAFHISLTAMGLAAVLATLPWAFTMIKWAGIAYLVYLAFKSWTADTAQVDRAARRTYGAAIKQGLITNIMNPKVALFILAFLPQFTDPTRGTVWIQILVLGGLFCVTGFVITATYGALAGLLGTKLSAKMALMNKLSALLLGALAVRLAWN